MTDLRTRCCQTIRVLGGTRFYTKYCKVQRGSVAAVKLTLYCSAGAVVRLSEVEMTLLFSVLMKWDLYSIYRFIAVVKLYLTTKHYAHAPL